MKRLLLFILFVFFTGFSSLAQIQNDIEQFEEENGKNYIKPLAYVVGANLNSGFSQTAKTLKPFTFRLTFSSMLAFVPTKERTFTATRPDLKDPISGYPLYSPEEVETATVFGDEGGTFHFSGDPFQFTNEEDIVLPNGLNTSVAPLLTPQISLGLPFGNEITVRYFPQVEVDPDFGKLYFYGFMFKHALNRSLLKLLPFDLALQIAYHSFSLGDILQIRSFSTNAQVSKQIFHWTLLCRPEG